MATTNGSLKNLSNDSLKLKYVNIWRGSEPPNQSSSAPSPIPVGGTERTFMHTGDSKGRSVGGFVYVCGAEDKFKWVIAWSNAKNELGKESNKVFTQILSEDENVDWDEIKRALDKSGHHCELLKDKFKAVIDIVSLDSSTPKVTATFGYAK